MFVKPSSDRLVGLSGEENDVLRSNISRMLIAAQSLDDTDAPSTSSGFSAPRVSEGILTSCITDDIQCRKCLCLCFVFRIFPSMFSLTKNFLLLGPG